MALSTGRRCSRKEEEAGRERNSGVKTEDGVMETCTHVTSAMDQCWPWGGLGRAGPKRDPYRNYYIKKCLIILTGYFEMCAT